MAELTDADRDAIKRARELAEVRGTDAVREHSGTSDITLAAVVTLAEAQELLTDLARRLERLGGS